MSKQKTNKPDFLLEACGHYLSDWDKNKYQTGESIVDALDEASRKGRYTDCEWPESVEIWFPFENYPMDEIAEMITHLSVTYKNMFDAGVEHWKQVEEEKT